jgi:adenylate cyclase
MASEPLPHDVAKALALLRADPERGRSVAELAAACGVAPRTLQKHFRRFLGGSPGAVLRDLRLDLVRRELLSGRAAPTIAALATRCGFRHLGRFSGWYRARYGESPSATLARSRCVRDEGGAPMVLPLAGDRPMVAVLPFELQTADPRRAAGIGEEIALALCRLRWIGVGPPHGARYHLRGSVREDAAGMLRVRVVLLDAASGRYLWADAWNGEPADGAAFEERVARAVAEKLQASLRNAEIERACRKEPEELTAWELTMRALERAVRPEPSAQTEALELAHRATECAPQDPLPPAIAAWCHGMRAGHCFTSRPTAEREAARDLAGRAAVLRARDPTAEALLASAYTLAHDLDRAALHVDRALALDGGCAWAWQRSGWLKVYRGEAADAIECFRIAQGLDPGDPLGFLSSLGIAAANFERADYAGAVRWFRRGVAENAAAVWANRFLAPACALAGQREAARASLGALLAVYPDWTITQVRSALPHSAGFLDRAASGLESIGMPL